MHKTRDNDLLQIILDDEGMELDEFLDEYALESVVPGICTTCEGVVFRCEPDATANWCEECQTNTVKSFLVLIGLC